MGEPATTFLYLQQQFCKSADYKAFVASEVMTNFDGRKAARLLRARRESRGWSAKELADRARGIALEQGVKIGLTQQGLSNFEKGEAKREPPWLHFVDAAFRSAEDETAEDAQLRTDREDSSVLIRQLPSYAGAGGGGTGEGDEGTISFSRYLVEYELRAPPTALLAMVIRGDSMEPKFQGGDQILVDTRMKSIAQPGVFCLWEGDGYVIKHLQLVEGADPQKVVVMSSNPIYRPSERLVEEIDLQGRVVWFGRRVF